jgi:hypothetical protein
MENKSDEKFRASKLVSLLSEFEDILVMNHSARQLFLFCLIKINEVTTPTYCKKFFVPESQNICSRGGTMSISWKCVAAEPHK